MPSNLLLYIRLSSWILDMMVSCHFLHKNLMQQQMERYIPKRNSVAHFGMYQKDACEVTFCGSVEVFW